MKKTIALLLALGMLLCLSACGGSAEPDPNAGLYEAVSATALGYTIPVEDVFEEGFSLELKNGGKAWMPSALCPGHAIIWQRLSPFSTMQTPMPAPP